MQYKSVRSLNLYLGLRFEKQCLGFHFWIWPILCRPCVGFNAFWLFHNSDVEEYPKEVENDQDNIGEMVKVDCHRSSHHYPGYRYLIMYHGTTWENARKIQAEGFIPSFDGMLSRVVYLSRDFKKAYRYPINRTTQKTAVLKVCARLGKVKRIDYPGHPLQKTWHHYGYDTAWVPPNCEIGASWSYDPWIHPFFITVFNEAKKCKIKIDNVQVK